MEKTIANIYLLQHYSVIMNNFKAADYKPMLDNIATFYSLSFIPDEKKLRIVQGRIMDGSTKELSEEVFSHYRNGAYGFASTIDLIPQKDDQIFYEDVALKGIEFEAMKDGKELMPLVPLLIDLLKEVADLIDVDQDDNDTFTFSEEYHSLSMWEEVKNNDLVTEKSKIVTDQETPLYIKMVENMARDLNDRGKYSQIKIDYYTNNFKADDNPFHDFIMNLGTPERDTQESFYKLATDLQNCL